MSDDKQLNPQRERGDQDPERETEHPRKAEGGAESYGGDPDAESSVTEQEIAAGSDRDQAEG